MAEIDLSSMTRVTVTLPEEAAARLLADKQGLLAFLRANDIPAVMVDVAGDVGFYFEVELRAGVVDGITDYETVDLGNWDADINAYVAEEPELQALTGSVLLRAHFENEEDEFGLYEGASLIVDAHQVLELEVDVSNLSLAEYRTARQAQRRQVGLD